MKVNLLQNKELLIGGYQLKQWNYPLIDFSNCPLYEKSNNEIRNFYKNIIDNIYKFDYDITFETFHEIMPIWNQKILDRAIFVSDIFKEEGLSERLYFKDNSLNFIFTELCNHIPSPYLLGFNQQFNFEIKERKFEKKFLYLNRKERNHREIMFSMLKNTNVLENSYYSYNSISNDLPDYKKIEYNKKYNINDFDIWLKDGQENWDFVGYGFGLLDEYHTTFCNIITESQSNHYWEGKQTRQVIITEKTEKCFVAGQPFVIVGNYGFIKTLKELGFKTFDKWWDESYDDEMDEIVRFKKIKDILLDISKWDIKKCEQVYQEMIPILKHNQNLNNEWAITNRNRQFFFPKHTTNVVTFQIENNII